MNKKVALLSIVAAVLILLIAKQTIFKAQPAATASQAGMSTPPISMGEILRAVDEKKKPMLMYVYAKSDCSSCAAAAQEDLAKVAELEKAFGSKVKVIRVNIYDYPEADVLELAEKLGLSQVPTTLVIDGQGVVEKRVGPVSQVGIRLVLEEVTKL
ncbi:hypothetical protein SY88_05300 [Clostridiales bacterium PH28_bin88]|nr:hypothetical protein SY88_05300 [Clostridiales bacterium PH28_bin88]